MLMTAVIYSLAFVDICTGENWTVNHNIKNYQNSVNKYREIGGSVRTRVCHLSKFAVKPEMNFKNTL